MYMSFTIIHISLHSLMQEFDSRVPRREAVQYWLRCPSHRDARANCTTSLLGTPESNSYTTERKHNSKGHVHVVCHEKWNPYLY